jgi:Ni,Fe-hydrogenase I cytochrome b subunit
VRITHGENALAIFALHNAHAATTYTLVFTLFLIEIITGFAMLTFGWGGSWHAAFGWVLALAVAAAYPSRPLHRNVDAARIRCAPANEEALCPTSGC